MPVLPGATGMPERSIGRTSETSDEQINGTKVFVATEVEDIGWRRNLFDRNKDAPPYRALVIRGFIAHQNRAVPIANDEKISSMPKANCIGYLTAVRGGVAPAKDAEVDLGEIVGKAIQVTVTSRPRNNGGFWLSMRQPAALMEGMPIPDCLKQYLTDEWEPFAWLDEEFLDRQLAALTGGEAPRRAAADPRDSQPHPNAPRDEDSAPPAGGAEIALQWPGVATITKATWATVAPVMRELLDRYFEGDMSELRRALEKELHDARALAGDGESDGVERFTRMLEWVALTDTGEVRFRMRDRTDQDAADLRDDLRVFGECIEAMRSQGDDGLIDPDDLPF